jgi:hypothetical protein
MHVGDSVNRGLSVYRVCGDALLAVCWQLLDRIHLVQHRKVPRERQAQLPNTPTPTTASATATTAAVVSIASTSVADSSDGGGGGAFAGVELSAGVAGPAIGVFGYLCNSHIHVMMQSWSDTWLCKSEKTSGGDQYRSNPCE